MLQGATNWLAILLSKSCNGNGLGGAGSGGTIKVEWDGGFGLGVMGFGGWIPGKGKHLVGIMKEANGPPYIWGNNREVVDMLDGVRRNRLVVF